MPLGLRFLPTPKKVKKGGEKVKNEGGIELKSLSDPLLNVSGQSMDSDEGRGRDTMASSPPVLLPKAESIHVLPDISPSAVVSAPPSDDGQLPGHDIDRVECQGPEDGSETPNPLEIPEMIGSYFDTNGNEVEDEEPLAAAAGPPIPQAPKCFINAAALLDDEPEYVPSPPPSLFFPSVEGGTTASPSRSTTSAGNALQVSPASSGIPIRRRVPVSKSFPDIIQTTIWNRDEKEDRFDSFKVKGPERMGESMIVADSLEEISANPCVGTHRDSIDVFDGGVCVPPLNPRVFDRIDAMMTDSILNGGGIINEKPPETWTVDFNSFNSETEEELRGRERRKSTSSTSSLAYFISMDEVDSDAESSTRKDDLTTSTDSGSKKIFSMFVDIGKGVDQSGSPKSSKIETSGPIKSREPNLRLKALQSGIPKYPHPHFPGVRGCQEFKVGGGGSMTSSMMMSSVSDTGRSQLFQGVSNRSSLHVANHEHDGSFTSSILSSMEMSALEDADMACQGGPCFKLGMDLLRMFQEGIKTDVNISVRGRFVRAHKCILASRSQYFAAILSGNWIQKAGNTIHLDEFSYNTVHFTMEHIYSGTNEIPESIDLMELATLTDMLGLEGLREVISQTIRNRFCHNFHRPCTGCIAGILEFFPLAVTYGMDDLQRKMTKWICKHFVRIWPTKAFANLGDPLVDKCLQFSISHLSPENLLDVTLGCDQLLSTMPSVRWTETVFSIVSQLSEACVQFTGEHFSEVLQSQRFLLFGKGQTWNISRIENTFLEGILLLKPDEACLSHVALSRLIELGTVTIDEVEWSTMFLVFLRMLRKEVEKYLLGNASKAVLSKNWELLSQEVRKRICSTSFLGSDKSGHNKKGTPGKPGHVTAGTVVPIPSRNIRPASGQSHTSGSTVSSSRARVSPQQVKVTEAMMTPRKSPSPSTAEDKRIPSPLPISEAAQKSTSTKSVASVRPMQSQPPTPVTATAPKTPNVYSTVTPVMSTKPDVSTAGRSTVTKTKGGKPVVGPTTQTREPHNLRKTVSLLEKERSFDTSSSRVSSAGSGTSAAARRGSTSSRTTPMKPLTPSTPSTKTFSTFSTVTKVSSVGVQRKAVVLSEPSPPPPPKPTFKTNSEKAKAVSKPKLVFRSQRSNSVSNEPPLSPLPTDVAKSHSRQGSVGTVMSTTGTPNLTQSSRYANLKPKTNSEKTIKAPLSPLPKSRFGNTPRSAPVEVSPRATMATVHGTGTYRVGKGRSKNVHGKNEEAPSSSMSRRGRKTDMDSSCHSRMSKSSIDTETEEEMEPKMRTLGEIGRSSTFSKDEPTILGKMDYMI